MRGLNETTSAAEFVEFAEKLILCVLSALCG
jgi:hypothetical protein